MGSIVALVVVQTNLIKNQPKLPVKPLLIAVTNVDGQHLFSPSRSHHHITWRLKWLLGWYRQDLIFLVFVSLLWVFWGVPLWTIKSMVWVWIVKKKLFFGGDVFHQQFQDGRTYKFKNFRKLRFASSMVGNSSNNNLPNCPSPKWWKMVTYHGRIRNLEKWSFY